MDEDGLVPYFGCSMAGCRAEIQFFRMKSLEEASCGCRAHFPIQYTIG